MPRGGPSRADQELLAKLALRGHSSITPYQLERWRRMGLLPRTKRHGLGRGKGLTSRYPDHALEVATALATHMRQGRSGKMTVFWLLLSGVPVEEKRVREAYEWAIDAVGGPSLRSPAEADRDRGAERAAKQVSTWDPLVTRLSDAFEEGYRPTREHLRRRDGLREAIEISAVAYVDEVTDDSLIRAMVGFGFISREDAELIQGDLLERQLDGRGELDRPRGPLRDVLHHQLSTASIEDLRDGLQTAAQVCGMNFLLFICAGLDGGYGWLDGEAIDLITQVKENSSLRYFWLMRMPMPHNLLPIAIASLSYVSALDLRQAAQDYADLLHSHIHDWLPRLPLETVGDLGRTEYSAVLAALNEKVPASV